MQVRYDEGVATHIGPEPCVVAREGAGEASAGECTGQPLSRERKIVPGADDVTWCGRQHGSDAPARAPGRLRRGQRPWHVWTLLAREPGDLAVDQGGVPHGPHREGEEP